MAGCRRRRSGVSARTRCASSASMPGWLRHPRDRCPGISCRWPEKALLPLCAPPDALRRCSYQRPRRMSRSRRANGGFEPFLLQLSKAPTRGTSPKGAARAPDRPTGLALCRQQHAAHIAEELGWHKARRSTVAAPAPGPALSRLALQFERRLRSHSRHSDCLPTLSHPRHGPPLPPTKRCSTCCASRAAERGASDGGMDHESRAGPL